MSKMVVGVKDAAFFVGYIGTIAGIFAAFRYRIRRVEEKTKVLSNVIFLEKGGLNVMTSGSCDTHRKTIEKSIERESNVTAKALERLDCLNENMIIVMTHMGLEPKRVKTTGKPVKIYRQVDNDNMD